MFDRANALREKIPESELAAHLASFGVGPDGIGEREKESGHRLAVFALPGIHGPRVPVVPVLGFAGVLRVRLRHREHPARTVCA